MSGTFALFAAACPHVPTPACASLDDTSGWADGGGSRSDVRLPSSRFVSRTACAGRVLVGRSEGGGVAVLLHFGGVAPHATR